MLHQFDHGAQDFVACEGNIDAVNASGVDEALHVLRGAENRRAARQRIAANAFKHRRAVVHDVRHHVERSVVPGDELAVMPDFVRLLNRHADSFAIKRFAEATRNSPRSKIEEGPSRSDNYNVEGGWPHDIRSGQPRPAVRLAARLTLMRVSQRISTMLLATNPLSPATIVRITMRSAL
jgi:hypothetical protein